MDFANFLIQTLNSVQYGLLLFMLAAGLPIGKSLAEPDLVGDAKAVMEAMKMEHTIKAPSDGTVEKVRYAVGDQVEDGAELIGFAETSTP